MKKILLTTVFRPFGVYDSSANEDKYNKKDDDLLLDYLASRLTREPGLFSLSSYVPNSGIHLIAANLPVKTKVMEWPTLQEFIEEIKKGYEYIGIQFIIKGFGKVVKMISTIKKYAKDSKIVLGGFGTMLEEVEGIGADYICKGEGVSFMRNLLKLEEKYNMVHPLISSEVTLKIFEKYDFIYKPKIGLITSGFGCPNKCEFCTTSAYYEGKNIRFLKTGKDVYEAMLDMNKKSNGEIRTFLIFEEDLMLYEDKVNELIECIRNDKNNTLSFGCFSSVSSLSNYKVEYLVSGGLDHVWIGVESKYADLYENKGAHFKKRIGKDITSIFKELGYYGVTTTASGILGLDHHRPDTLKEELDFIASLNPSTFQLSNLMAAKGTVLRERLEKENRIISSGYKDADLFSEIASHSRFSKGELTKRVLQGYNSIYDEIGPSIYRIMMSWFEGYTNIKGKKDPFLERRAKELKRRVKGVLPIFLKTTNYLPNKEVKEKVEGSLEKIYKTFGKPSDKEKQLAEIVELIFSLEDKKKSYCYPVPIEPKLIVTNYM